MALIENQLVKVKWHYSNEKWFVEKGYVKSTPYLEVPLKDLMLGSKLMVKVNCDFCHKDYEQRYNVVNKGMNHFCSRDCLNSFRKINGSPNKTKVKLNCFNCNKEIEVQKYRYDNLLNGKVAYITCSRKCQSIVNGQNNKGENNVNYKEKIKMNCVTCNDEFEIEPNRVGRAKYCSVKCQRVGVGKQNIPTKKMKVNCDNCEKEFSRWEHEFNKYEYHFCSSDCRVACQGLFISKQKGNYDTRCQVVANEILDSLKIKYINEKPFASYAVDNFLQEDELIIEIMGDYWHSNPLKYKDYDSLNNTQKQRVISDKSKRTYFYNNHQIKILYLWEHDLMNTPLLCEKLINLYIENKGNLTDYNSFNYNLFKNNIVLNDKIILPYFLKKNTKRQITPVL